MVVIRLRNAQDSRHRVVFGNTRAALSQVLVQGRVQQIRAPRCVRVVLCMRHVALATYRLHASRRSNSNDTKTMNLQLGTLQGHLNKRNNNIQPSARHTKDTKARPETLKITRFILPSRVVHEP